MCAQAYKFRMTYLHNVNEILKTSIDPFLLLLPLSLARFFLFLHSIQNFFLLLCARIANESDPAHLSFTQNNRNLILSFV